MHRMASIKHNSIFYKISITILLPIGIHLNLSIFESEGHIHVYINELGLRLNAKI